MQRVRLNDNERRTPRPTRLGDGIENAMSGMGTGRDKQTWAMFTSTVLPKEQLDMAYRGDWIARKIIDIPAYDSTREWRQWQAETKDITALEALEKTFNLQRKLMLALQKARLYGGGCLIMGINQGSPDQEVNLKSLGKGSLKFVHAVSRHELMAGPMDQNIDSPYFGEPSYYTRQATGMQAVKLHPSRVIRLLGAELPDMTVSDGWSDSILTSVRDAIISASTVTQGVAQLVNEAQVDVIKVPDLTASLSSAAYEAGLKKRFGVAAQMKSIYNMLLLDAAEEWERITSNFATLPDVLKMYLMIVSGAADIPATRMLSQSPAGLSATGESDTRNYYDRLKTEQRTNLSPVLNRLDEVLIRSALGSRPEELFYDWNSLWQMTDNEKAELAKKKADTFQIDVNSAVMDPVVLREARIAQLIEDGTYPGLEMIIEEQDLVQAALEESPAPDATEPDEEEPTPANENKQPTRRAIGDMASRVRAQGKKAKKVKMADALPRSLYVYRKIVNAKDIVSHFKKQGIGTMYPPGELHVTIAYSKTKVDWMKAGEAHGQDEKGHLTITPGGVRMVERFGPSGNILVLAFASSELTWRWRSIQERTGAEWKWDDYQPHISLSNEGHRVTANLEPYKGPIIFGPEVFEEVVDGAMEEIVEDSMWAGE